MSATETAADCWFLTGPTASGKTEVAVVLADLLDAEIISLDSMAVYRGLDIGTAKPPPELRRRVSHHLIDLVDPAEEFSVAQYVELAECAVREIFARGRTALFVGGTPLYLKSLLRGLFRGPPADWEFRRQVETELQSAGNEALHRRLQQVDPLSATRLHPNDTRRIVRALEVYRLTGQPISHLQMQFDEGRPARECRVFVLERSRKELHQRIETRVQTMFAKGLIDEVRGLMDREKPLGRTASQAVGYREVMQHLRGRQTLEQTQEQVVARTRRFAKRQMTWFRSLCECRFLPVTGQIDLPPLAQQIAEAGSRLSR